MSGKQQFDDTLAINQAMTVFWRRGFVAASIDELTQAMGLSRSSLYKRFRDKEGLYQEVLAVYNERVLLRMGRVEAATRRARMEALLLEFIPDRFETKKPGGCMLARACVEMTELPPNGRATALEGMEGKRAILRATVNAAVANGELRPSTDVEAMVWHYFGVLHAIMNLPQIGATTSDLRQMVAFAMSAWPESSDETTTIMDSAETS